MQSLLVATSLLALSLIPIVSVLLIWRERMRRDIDERSLPVEMGEWMRVEEKGPVIGHRGAQEIYEWILVELADGSHCRLSADLPNEPPGFCFRMVRLEAGTVIYWGLASNASFGSPVCHSLSASRAKGFSLLELMIVVAMIAILTAIALPIYQAYVQQAAAKAIPPALMQMAQQVQQFAQDHDTYVGACSSAPLVPNAQLTCPTMTQTGYVVQAQGTGPIAGLTYTLTQSGSRATPTAPSGWPTSAACWVINPSGDCAS